MSKLKRGHNSCYQETKGREIFPLGKGTNHFRISNLTQANIRPKWAFAE